MAQLGEIGNEMRFTGPIPRSPPSHLSDTGEGTYAEGSRETASHDTVLFPLEQALSALSWSTCLLGIAVVRARIGH